MSAADPLFPTVAGLSSSTTSSSASTISSGFPFGFPAAAGQSPRQHGRNNPSTSSPSQISKIYRQASTLFLTRRLPEALTTLRPLTVPPVPPSPHAGNGPDENDASREPAPVASASRSARIKVWSLYLTILNAVVELVPQEGKDTFGNQEWRKLCARVREGDVWEEVINNGYHGAEGNVDSDVVINLATLLLAHARTQTLNQKRLESYLASCDLPNLDLTSQVLVSTPTPKHSKHRSGGADTPRDLSSRVKILELYTLHVLPRNNEWDYAREFIGTSSVLDEERRDAFLQALDSLQEQQEEDRIRQERDEQTQKVRLAREEEERKREREEEHNRRKHAEEKEKEKEREKERDREREEGRERERYKTVASRKSTLRTGTDTDFGVGSPRVTGPRGNSKPTSGTRAGVILTNIRAFVEQLGYSLTTNSVFLTRLLAFILGIIIVFSQRGVRARARRIFATSWAKVRATAGMGMKVTYF